MKLVEFIKVYKLPRFLWQMLKKDYKAHLAANQFDLNTLPICEARTRSGGYESIRATLVMVDVNATVETLQGK